MATKKTFATLEEAAAYILQQEEALNQANSAHSIAINALKEQHLSDVNNLKEAHKIDVNAVIADRDEAVNNMNAAIADRDQAVEALGELSEQIALQSTVTGNDQTIVKIGKSNYTLHGKKFIVPGHGELSAADLAKNNDALQVMVDRGSGALVKV